MNIYYYIHVELCHHQVIIVSYSIIHNQKEDFLSSIYSDIDTLHRPYL